MPRVLESGEYAEVQQPRLPDIDDARLDFLEQEPGVFAGLPGDSADYSMLGDIAILVEQSKDVHLADICFHEGGLIRWRSEFDTPETVAEDDLHIWQNPDERLGQEGMSAMSAELIQSVDYDDGHTYVLFHPVINGRPDRESIIWIRQDAAVSCTVFQRSPEKDLSEVGV